MNLKQLAAMGATLANRGLQPVTGARVLDADLVPHVLALMRTAGLYDASGDWAFRVGLPATADGNGSLLAIVPGRFAIAAFSPRLNEAGRAWGASEAVAWMARGLKLGVYAEH